jgi:hypothetical protein
MVAQAIEHRGQHTTRDIFNQPALNLRDENTPTQSPCTCTFVSITG